MTAKIIHGHEAQKVRTATGKELILQVACMKDIKDKVTTYNLSLELDDMNQN